MKALDLFAGAGGWDVAAHRLGIDTHRVEIWDRANETAMAAGFPTIHTDVKSLTATGGQYDLLIASPPCQTYSMAGKGEGRKNLDRVLTAIHEHHDLSDLDERIGLVLEPLRLFRLIKPPYVAWEQVPAVLPIWQACAQIMREMGWSVATGIVTAEMYGVPQTRRRAVLIARKDGREARLPEPTHSRFHIRDPKRLDEGVKPWVSMAEALGWGMTERPSMTVCGGGTETGGAEPFGNAARQGIRRELEAGRWVQRSNYSAPGRPGQTAAERGRTTRALEQPSIAVTGKSFQWAADGDPASSRGIRVLPEEAACLQTFPDGYPFQGNKGERFQQIGNAVPPLLAEAILKELIK
jgi:DNA (cytosine-5)-methyltransferase 1